MKRVEIKRFDPLNMGKVMVYMMIIPSALCALVGFVMIPVGLMIGKGEVAFMGAVVGIGYPILFIVMYGISGIIGAYLYNWFAGKWGGLIADVDERESVD